MSALDRILAYKRDEVAALKASGASADLSARAASRRHPRGFASALARIADAGENALICEIKRKSPSAGDILLGADPADVARDYEAGGAACLSVLTDSPSFGGHLTDLEAVGAVCDLPMLRKDFMLDPLQVLEARAYGADAVLVIMAAVDDAQAEELCEAAWALGMDVLVETHAAPELDRALELGARALIGVNNRNLKTMSTDLSVTEALARRFPADRPIVSESGVKTSADIRRLRAVGARRFLIGESLMKETNRKSAVSALRYAGTFDEKREHN